jgi:hypothetical protein
MLIINNIFSSALWVAPRTNYATVVIEAGSRGFRASSATKTNAEVVAKEPELLQPGAWDMGGSQDAEDFDDCYAAYEAI